MRIINGLDTEANERDIMMHIRDPYKCMKSELSSIQTSCGTESTYLF